MERHLFGTDGVRGVSNRHPMTVEMAVRLGKAIAAHFLRGRRRGGISARPRVVIGKDTRLSGYMFEHSLAAGLMSMGVDVQIVGPMPTPGIAFMTTGMRADAGIVISASHNPYQDNGIKIFGSDGFKLPDEEELAIEILVDSDEALIVDAPLVGRAKRIEDATGRYIVNLKNTFPRDLTLDGLRVVIDCANGAAYKVAPTVLRELGAEVFPIGVDPSGLNINEDCGSLHPHNVARRVHETRADVGIALDGDADRLILIDEKGERIDGDKILALCALYLKSQGKLLHDTLVATVMSNIGLDIALRRQGVHVARSPVGDRYVVEQMRQHGYNLGGEQSGHLIFMDHSTTGDGTLAALQVLAIMRRKERPLSEIAQVMEPLPQVLVNVEVRAKPPLDTLETFQHQRELVEGELGDEGRVLVRYSGTESKARVMVEGPDDHSVHHYAQELADCLRREIGA